MGSMPRLASTEAMPVLEPRRTSREPREEPRADDGPGPPRPLDGPRIVELGRARPPRGLVDARPGIRCEQVAYRAERAEPIVERRARRRRRHEQQLPRAEPNHEPLLARGQPQVPCVSLNAPEIGPYGLEHGRASSPQRYCIRAGTRVWGTERAVPRGRRDSARASERGPV